MPGNRRLHPSSIYGSYGVTYGPAVRFSFSSRCASPLYSCHGSVYFSRDAAKAVVVRHLPVTAEDSLGKLQESRAEEEIRTMDILAHASPYLGFMGLGVG